MGVWTDIQLAQQRKEGHRENAARDVNLYMTFVTTGTGELTSDLVMFELPFFQEPTVLSGHVLTEEPDRNVFKLPAATAGVYEWEINERGYYIGCKYFFFVSCETLSGGAPSSIAAPTLTHHFMFTGPSYKPMSEEINFDLLDDEVPPLVPPLDEEP